MKEKQEKEFSIKGRFFLRSWNKGKGVDGPIVQAVVYIIVFIIVLLSILPFLVTIMLSLKSSSDFAQGFLTFPKKLMWSNYSAGIGGLWANMANSIILCLISSFGVVAISSIAAYVFVRHEFPLKNVLFFLILALMMVPGVLTMTPQYLTMQALGLKDTWWAILFPAISGGQIGSIFLFRTFMGQQPKDLFESAVLDGAGDFVMYFYIAVPLAVPVLAIQAVGTFGAVYNDYLWPQLVISKRNIQTLMPLLRQLAGEVASLTKNEGARYATYLVSGIPLIFTTAFGLKFFINGDFAAGLKL